MYVPNITFLMLQHSCVPNCIVNFNEDNTAIFVTLGDIEAGTELVHSYVEEQNSLEDRRDELRTYGFECNCPKCVLESTSGSATSHHHH
jgi:SET domain-containing protein